MTIEYNPNRLFLFIIIIVLFVLGFALFGISYLPFELFKTKIDTFAFDGSADFFTATIFKQIVIGLRFIGIALLFTCGLFYIYRQQIQQHFLYILTSLFSFLNELTQNFKSAVIKEDKIHLYAFFVIMLLAIEVKVFFLFQPMRTDEIVTFMHFASKPLYVALSYYPEPNNHLFHTFFVHIVYLLLGNKPWVIRLPALFAGILLVPASYVVIRIFFDKYAAILTASIVASSSLLIEFSTNARGYTLLSLFFLLILAIAPYLKQSKNPAAWFLFAIISALGFYTIPIMLYPFGIVITWLFLSIIFKDTRLNRKQALKNLIMSMFITAFLAFMLYVPAIISTDLKSIISHPKLASKPWSLFIEEIPSSLLSVWNAWNGGFPAFISFLLVIGFFTSLVFHKRLSFHRIPIILALAIYLTPVIIVFRVVPPMRVWLFLFPLYVGVASSGMSYLLRIIESKIGHYLPVICATLAITLSVLLSFYSVHTLSANPFFYPNGKWFSDAESVTIYLKDNLKPGDRVLVAYRQNPNINLGYYFKMYNVPVKYLLSDLNSSYRIWIIVYRPDYQKLRKYLEELDKKGVLGINYSVSKEIQHYEQVNLYKINRGK